jgi:hypothetical protein
MNVDVKKPLSVVKRSVSLPTSPIEHAVLSFLTSFLLVALSFELPLITVAIRGGVTGTPFWGMFGFNLLWAFLVAILIAGILYATMSKNPLAVHFLKLATIFLQNLQQEQGPWVGGDLRTELAVVMNQITSELDSMEHQEAAQVEEPAGEKKSPDKPDKEVA